MNFQEYLEKNVNDFQAAHSLSASSYTENSFPLDLEASSLSAPVKRIKTSSQFHSNSEFNFTEKVGNQNSAQTPKHNEIFMNQQGLRKELTGNQIPVITAQRQAHHQQGFYNGNPLRNRKHKKINTVCHMKVSKIVNKMVCKKLEEDCDDLCQKILALQEIQKRCHFEDIRNHYEGIFETPLQYENPFSIKYEYEETGYLDVNQMRNPSNDIQ